MNRVYSMTGYGRSVYVSDTLKLKIEIRSLNNRYLDLNFRMPKLLFALEDKMRSLISSQIMRGKLDIYIELRRFNEQNSRLVVKRDLLQQYLEIFEELYIEGKTVSRPDPLTLASLPDLFELEDISDPQELEEPLLASLQEALSNLKNMRTTEGEHLKTQILSMADCLRDALNTIREMSPTILSIYRDSMEQRISDMLKREDLLSEERLELELAIYAERKDITEELTRMDSHLNQLDSILHNAGSIGRKLDFLAQELGREINTIGSKASGYPISHQVIEMKSLLEQIREQVQNLE
ncbi:MAG: YicC/YloC family endoribonuclease [Bacillota bacterium]|nr:YicC/YloC family endoribonuclease [Bacillota bacterium]